LHYTFNSFIINTQAYALFKQGKQPANQSLFMVSEPILTKVIFFSSATPTQMAVNQTEIPPLVPNPQPVANPLLAANPPTLPTLITFNHFNPLKLTPGNYNHWLPHIVPHLKGGNLFGYVDGTHRSPPPTLVTTTDAVVSVSPNPGFLHWQMQDQLILGAINSSLSEKMLSHVTRATSREAWLTLETLFASQSHARTMNMHFQLATLKKGSSSITDYYQHFQQLADALTAVNKLLSNFEMVSFLLAGLGSEYDPFVTSVQTRVEPLPVEELYGHLLANELCLESHNTTIDLAVLGANVASQGSSSFRSYRGGRSQSHNSSGRGSPPRHSPRFNRGRGRGSSGPRHSSNRPLCQICNKLGHLAITCYSCFDNSYSNDTSSPMQAYLSTPGSTFDSAWYPDSGATHHLTSDLANLNISAADYSGSDCIQIGNGKGLPIHHIGKGCLFSPPLHFDLSNILHVPMITKNLLLVHQFTKDTNTFFEFHPDYFFLKDRRSGKVLLRGPNNHGLYQFPPTSNKPCSSALIGERVSLPQWHLRLGQPAFKLVRQVISSFNLPVSSTKHFELCPACLGSKSKQLSFSLSQSQATCPLELIYTDVWGPSPVCSTNGSKYYVSFLDAFSRYMWLYPLSCKADVTTVFIKFQSYVERFFESKIKFVQSDWGGGVNIVLSTNY
jgi:hypothetical protein